MEPTLNIESLISDLALILVLGAIATILFKKLKQPVVLGYIVAGFIASPQFSLFPSVAGEANIEFWAQIGIIVLLFSLGLEFSFKKLLNVGGSAMVTALIIVIGMMGVGYIVGNLLGFHAIDSIFLGGMLSMSSTTIIIKALTDLNMRQRRFVPLVFAVLIVEDLFAVVMMVILSSIAINKTVESGEMVRSIIKLSFFLVMWFTVGVFIIPSVFKRFRRIISDELMLVISMGLCFLMAIFSVKSGFSMALGAFVMGSILAGTSEAERIERIIMPVKDLFGAVFFISVGMMVDPQVIVQHAGTITILSVVVIIGMILFGSFGMLATGQPLKIAMESGFCLTQIGEFSFIIATLGMTLGVLEPNIYPIIVAVSVITTFFTPFFIKSAEPCYNFVARRLPKRLEILLNGYSRNATQNAVPKSKKVWKSVTKRYLLRTLLYSVVIIMLIILCRRHLIPFIMNTMGWGKFIGVALSVFVIMPFIYALLLAAASKTQRKQLVKESGAVSYVPIVVMTIVNSILAMWFITGVLYGFYSGAAAVLTGIGIVLILMILLAPIFNKRITRIEQRFMSNINERDNRRTGKENTLVSDLHLAYMNVNYGCPFVGEKLRNADLRRKYGINIVNIQRNNVIYPVPSGDMRIFPGDVLGVIGTDEQIQNLLPLVEAVSTTNVNTTGAAKFIHFALGDNAPILNKTLAEARLREDYASLLVAVQRDEDNFITPSPELVFETGDVLWIVGDPDLLAKLK